MLVLFYAEDVRKRKGELYEQRRLSRTTAHRIYYGVNLLFSVVSIGTSSTLPVPALPASRTALTLFVLLRPSLYHRVNLRVSLPLPTLCRRDPHPRTQPHTTLSC